MVNLYHGIFEEKFSLWLELTQKHDCPSGVGPVVRANRWQGARMTHLEMSAVFLIKMTPSI